MKQSWPIKIITSGRGIIFNEKNEILLVSSNENDWHLPGGMIDNIESSSDACIREVYEETGLEIEIKSLACISEDIYDHRKIFKNFLRITQFYYRCTTNSTELNLNWKDPDGELIKYRKFFSEKEYLSIKYPLFHQFEKISFKEIQQLQNKHLGYFNRTNLTNEELQNIKYIHLI